MARRDWPVGKSCPMAIPNLIMVLDPTETIPHFTRNGWYKIPPRFWNLWCLLLSFPHAFTPNLARNEQQLCDHMCVILPSMIIYKPSSMMRPLQFAKFPAGICQTYQLPINLVVYCNTLRWVQANAPITWYHKIFQPQSWLRKPRSLDDWTTIFCCKIHVLVCLLGCLLVS